MSMKHTPIQSSLFQQNAVLLTLIMTVAGLLFATPARAAETEGVHCSVVIDQDGDEVVLMESEWISMHLLPRMQAIINRFVFRPTGNDIIEVLVPKIRLANGAGILMDCLWEQDWRFQELKEKPYQFQITKNGPDEGQVVFETDITGWVGSDNSGVISDLISNMTLRRTVTLKAGEPFFRFDFEFISNDGKAKRPTFWAHNGSIITTTGREAVQRPSARGILEISGPRNNPDVTSDHFVYDFNEGWSARLSPERNEGIVYLMDYDDTKMLYNSANNTSEWMYDGILALPDQPWKGRVYILPFIGLSSVDFANEYFMCQLVPKREDGQLKLEYVVTSSYENAARVTFNTEVEYDLLSEEKQVDRLSPVMIEGLAFQPTRGQGVVAFDAPDPLVFNITAFVELPDGDMKKFTFQKWYQGEYDSGQGQNTQRNGKPVRLLDRDIRRPDVPPPPADMAINRDDFKAFGVLGLGSTRMGLVEAVNDAEGMTLDIGYCTGSDHWGYGLSDFPFDYKRLFDYRVLLVANANWNELRSVGASVVYPWLEQGGGLVLSGGEHAFAMELPEHEINKFLPIQPKRKNLVEGAQRLQAPEDPSHPIFDGIDFSDMPGQLYCHDVQIKEGLDAKVLMRIGPYPFIVEYQQPNGQVTMAVMNNHFGTEDQLGYTHVMNWSQWSKLYANIVRYAGGAER